MKICDEMDYLPFTPKFENYRQMDSQFRTPNVSPMGATSTSAVNARYEPDHLLFRTWTRIKDFIVGSSINSRFPDEQRHAIIILVDFKS